MKLMKCPICHRELPDNAKICSYCGNQIIDKTESVQETADKDPIQDLNHDSKHQQTKRNQLKFLAGIAVFICVACIAVFLMVNNNNSETADSKPKSKKDQDELILDKDDFELEEHQQDYIEANIDCTYQVKDENIAVVDRFGTITALSPGKTEITVEGENGQTTICEVTVYEAENIIEISSYEASSTLEQEPYHYEISQLYDNNYSTCWSEGASANGIGETIKINLAQEAKINQLNIVNGYGKKEDLYYKNNRVKKLALIFDDGDIEYIDVKDSFNQLQNITFTPHKTQSIVVRIDEIYQGNKYQDTCISELTVDYH